MEENTYTGPYRPIRLLFWKPKLHIYIYIYIYMREISLLNRMLGWSLIGIRILIFYLFLELLYYTLYIFSYRQHGQIYSGIYPCSLGYSREFLLLFLHWFPLNLLILKGEYKIMIIILNKKILPWYGYESRFLAQSWISFHKFIWLLLTMVSLKANLSFGFTLV